MEKIQIYLGEEENHYLWDTQRDKQADLDFLRGRTIEYAETDEEEIFTLILEEKNGN